MSLSPGWACPQVLFPQEREEAWCPQPGLKVCRAQQGHKGQQQSPVWGSVSKCREPGSWLSPAFSWRPALRPGWVSQASKGLAGQRLLREARRPRGRQQRLHQSHLITASGPGSRVSAPRLFSTPKAKLKSHPRTQKPQKATQSSKFCHYRSQKEESRPRTPG